MASNFDLYSPYATQMAQQYGVPTNLFLWQIGQESSWDPNAHNSTPGSTATGLGQFINSTAQSFGIDPTNPYQSLQAAAQYDAQLYNQTGSWPAAMQAYGTTSGGTQIPSGVLDTATSGVDATIQRLLGIYSTRAPAEAAGVGNQAELDAWNSSWGGAISKFETWISGGIERVGIVILGIVIIGLAIWALLRRSGTV